MTRFNQDRQKRYGAKRGFALLVAIIFMSVMLIFGLALGSLAYKQEVLATSAINSQYAFYAADAALECVLKADQQDALFSDPTAPSPKLYCDGVTYNLQHTTSADGKDTIWTIQPSDNHGFISLDAVPGPERCASVKVYKPTTPGDYSYFFSEGFNISCAELASPSNFTFRVVSRGLEAHY